MPSMEIRVSLEKEGAHDSRALARAYHEFQARF